MSTSDAPLERLLSPVTGANDFDRKVLAGLLLELARNVDANVGVESPALVPLDPRLEQLRALLLGREIELTRHFHEVLDDPEQLAIAVSRVLPAAIAQAAARDERLGQVLAPALGSSVRRDPNTLVDILHPLIGPAIGKSIDATFESFNESLKHSLSWRGLRWRWEAWRTGTSFAEVVLKHTLVYRVEHVFLIHRHTGLLIAHAASTDATSQDPQLVSSMLAAIQDFVRDSFAEQQGLDSLRLGELRVWSEPGPFATLVAVIRGNPPEELHDTFRTVLNRIHAERPEALETFTGDSSGFTDVQAAITDCVQLRQEAARSGQRSYAWWIIGLIALALVSALATWGYWRWQDSRLWESYLARLKAQPGIVITESGDKWQLAGMRDPLAADPQRIARDLSIDPARVTTEWQPYQSLNPEFVLKRAQEALDPPAGITLAVDGDRIVATGSAPAAWIQRARASSRLLPAGVSQLDLSQVRDLDEADDQLWNAYVAKLRAAPGLAITEIGKHDGKWHIGGLRDPLAADPDVLLRQSGIEPDRVVAHWQPYQSLSPEFVLKRAQEALNPPAGITLAVDGDRIVAIGSAPAAWIQRARASSRLLPVGVLHLDLSQVRDLDEADQRLWDAYVARLRASPGIAITEIGKRDGKWHITGMRDPLAADPDVLLRQSGIEPDRVVAHWQPYQSLNPEFVLRRAQEALDPPAGITLAVDGDRIVATGSAPAAWIQRARASSRLLPVGVSHLDLSQVRDLDEADERLWDAYVARLRAAPGIAITEIGKRDGKWHITGMRDPLAVDPDVLLRQSGIEPDRVVMHWLPYQSLNPQFVLRRAQDALSPPATVTLAIEGDRIVAIGSAPNAWLERARAFSRVLPGVAQFDLAQVRDLDAADEQLWDDYVARLQAAPGIAITDLRKRDGRWFIRGLRDPLAVDPEAVLRQSKIDATRVVAHWEPYQSLHADFVLKRLQQALAPPPTVTFAVEGDRIVATGSAAATWIRRAQIASRELPLGAPVLDLSQVRDINEGTLGKLRDAIQSKEIRFDLRNPNPSRGQEAVLDRLADELKELTALSSTLRVSTRVTLTGHSDVTGVSLYNLALSLARAETVRTLLKQRGVDPDLLSVRSAGTLEPREQADTEAARALNRRVSFTVLFDE